MVTKVLNPYKNTMGLNEISQTTEVRMAYVSKQPDGSYNQLHDDVKCRDFLGDAVWSMYIKQPVKIYGFMFDPNKTPLDQDKMRLVLNFKGDVNLTKIFLNNLEIVHKIEQQHKLFKTSAYRVKDTKDKLIVEASKFWMKSVFNVSLYTYLLKVMCYQYQEQDFWRKELVSRGGTEGSYTQQVQNVWDFYIKELKRINRGKFNPTGDNCLGNSAYIVQCHNYCGFVSLRFMNKDTLLSKRLKKLYKEYTNVPSTSET